ncbi:MAG: PAS domain S-box protein [Proteobacteria bacterium]|nr:PAS domain S-box protein [Pseudomonadota bacterium]
MSPKNWPIWLQIITFFFWMILLVGLISGVLLRDLETEYLYNTLKDYSNKTSDMLTVTSIDAIITEDIPLLETIVTQAHELDHQIQSLTISNENSVVLTHWERKKKTKIPPMEFSRMMVLEGEKFGEMKIAWDIDLELQKIEAHAVKIRWFSSGILFLLMILLLLGMQWLVINPIRIINKRLLQFEAGDHSTQLKFNTSKELSRQVNSINNLVLSYQNLKGESENRLFAEREQRKVSMKLEAVIDASPLAIISLNRNKEVLIWNYSASSMFGYSVGDVAGAKIKCIAETRLSWFNQLLDSALQGHEIRDVETLGTCKTGEELDITIYCGPVLDLHNNISGAMLILEDISNRKKEQEKRQFAYKTGVSENAATVLHNIGNAITPIQVNFALMLENCNYSEKLLGYLRKLESTFSEQHNQNNMDNFFNQDKKGQKMLPFLSMTIGEMLTLHEENRRIIENLSKPIGHVQEIIKTQKGYAKQIMKDEKFQIASLMYETIQIYQPKIKKLNIHLQAQIDPSLPLITSNKNKVLQVFLNLLKNALESIENRLKIENTISSEINIVVTTHQDNGIRCIINDNGEGFDKGIQEKIFNFGYSTKVEGTGIGLHDSAVFIGSTGGQISLVSPGPGQGATAEIFLPFTH